MLSIVVLKTTSSCRIESKCAFCSWDVLTCIPLHLPTAEGRTSFRFNAVGLAFVDRAGVESVNEARGVQSRSALPYPPDIADEHRLPSPRCITDDSKLDHASSQQYSAARQQLRSATTSFESDRAPMASRTNEAAPLRLIK
jgi:hypothetical protein